MTKNPEQKFQMHILPLASQASREFQTMSSNVCQRREVLYFLFFRGNGDSAVCHIMYFLSFLVNDVNIRHQDSKMQAFVSTLSDDAWMWYYGLPDKSITFLKNCLELFFKRWHNGEEDMMTALVKAFDQLKKIREQIEQHLHDDLIENVYQNSDIVEDPPHDPSTETIED